MIHGIKLYNLVVPDPFKTIDFGYQWSYLTNLIMSVKYLDKESKIIGRIDDIGDFIGTIKRVSLKRGDFYNVHFKGCYLESCTLERCYLENCFIEDCNSFGNNALLNCICEVRDENQLYKRTYIKTENDIGDNNLLRSDELLFEEYNFDPSWYSRVQCYDEEGKPIYYDSRQFILPGSDPGDFDNQFI